MVKRILLAACLTAAAMAPLPALAADTLENLERERALTVRTLIDPALGPGDRAGKLEIATRRLTDLERMAIRDDSLTGDTSPVVRVAFKNYDLTFLVHASVERNVTLIDQWMEQVGISTDSLMTARVGRRY
ncbi:hypothetical protein [Pacificispira sp.]|uniref:hypothetical protein n=1 Tax=Pacificispira sp. TaxID=2888761 RepID=UPI003BA9F8C4